MTEETIKNFVINASYFDVLDYEKRAITPVVDEYEKNQWSYIVEIMIITIKSLKPSQAKGGNVIDYKRFKNELNLWKFYRHGMNRNLLYSTSDMPYENYFAEMDESVYSRIAIITLSNQNFEVIRSEVIKSVLFTSGNIEVILESLMLAKMLFLISRDKSIKYEDIVKSLKDESISFSQIELSDYNKYYKLSEDSYEKNYKVEFERVRINLISLLNDVDISNQFANLKICLDILKLRENEEDYQQLEYNSFFISGLLGLLKGEILSREIKDVNFLESLCAYVLKLRKGRINSEDLELKSYESLDVFNYKEGEAFNHPLLNSAKLIYKGQRENFEMAYIKTQTGIYRFVNLLKN